MNIPGALALGCGAGAGGTGAAFGASLGHLARLAGMPAQSGRGLGFGRACSGAGLGAGSGALRLWKLWKMLYAGPWPSRGRCIPRMFRMFLQVGGAMFDSLFDPWARTSSVPPVMSRVCVCRLPGCE